MSEGMNRVTLLGNLGSDPELRVTQSGQSVLNIRLATSESYKERDSDEWKERTEWHNVCVWGKRAEGLNRILCKGSRIVVEGSLRTSSYDKDGTKHYRTEVVASDVYLAGGQRREEGERRDDRRDQRRDNGRRDERPRGGQQPRRDFPEG